MTEVDVFISNYTLVDPEIYQLWIEGYTGKLTKETLLINTISIIIKYRI